MVAAAAAATRLYLMWLASPALPVGGFSYSEGLEAAVDAGLVSDEAGAAAWLRQQLELSLARSELPLAAEAHAAWGAHDAPRIGALQDWYRSTRENAEQRRQGEQMGRALLDWLRNSDWSADPRVAALAALRPAPGWPIAFALATVLAGADREDAALALAFGWAENMVQAATKSVPLGQAAAQRILAALAAAIPDAVQAALALPPDRRQCYAPMLAILGARHEAQYTRLFRS